MSAPLTGSTLDRGAACPPSFHLPQHREIDPPRARWGSEGHDFLRDVSIMGRDEALAAIVDPAARERCAAIRAERLPAMHPDGYQAEVGIAWHVPTRKARILGAGMTHGQAVAALRPGEIGGVIDILGITPDRSTVIAGDYKFGWRRLAPAMSHRQVRFYSLAAARALGATRAVGAIIYVRSEDRDPWFDVATFTGVDLFDVADELDEIVAGYEEAGRRLQAGTLTVSDLLAGPHCDFCPAFKGCPVQLGLIRAMADPGTALVPASSAVSLRDEEAWERDGERAIKLLDDFERAFKSLRSSVHAMAMAHPLKLSNSLVYGPVTSERDTIDGDRARAVLVTKFPAEEVNRAASWTFTKASLRKLTDPRALPRKKTEDHERLVAELRAAGAVSTRITSSVKMHRADEKADKEEIDG